MMIFAVTYMSYLIINRFVTENGYKIEKSYKKSYTRKATFWLVWLLFLAFVTL